MCSHKTPVPRLCLYQCVAVHHAIALRAEADPVMAGARTQKGDPVLHIDLRKWADFLVSVADWLMAVSHPQSLAAACLVPKILGCVAAAGDRPAERQHHGKDREYCRLSIA